MSSKVEISSYQPEWPEQYESEGRKIKTALGKNCVAIHHVGSTSVPGLSAKPRIDMVIEVDKFDSVIESLESIGIEYMGEWNIPMHYGFRRREGVQLNLHVYQKGHPEVELNLKFRDYLRATPEAVKAYSDLKHKLLEKAESHTKEGSIFKGYTLGKSGFIQDILRKSGYDRLRFVIATHHSEWDSVKHYRDKYFFKPHNIEDPYTWTFEHEDHKHLILYQGIDVVGYAHIQFWPAHRAAMRMIAIDENKRHLSLGAQFNQMLEEWLKHKGILSLHVESSPSAKGFYTKQGYLLMDFNDPDGYEGGPEDIEMGKVL